MVVDGALAVVLNLVEKDMIGATTEEAFVDHRKERTEVRVDL